MIRDCPWPFRGGDGGELACYGTLPALGPVVGSAHFLGWFGSSWDENRESIEMLLMDGLDGKVARLTNTASEFGIQYDSLADLVAFGVAPAFTSWMWVLEGYGKLGIGVAFLYVACTALRLARFNVCVTTVSKKFFVGLPCPAAGCAVAMFILFSSYLPSWLEARTPFLGLVVTFVMALLMVSRVRYFSFKEYGFLKTHAFSSMISALLVFVLILSQPVVFGFLLGAIYLLSGPIYTYIILPRRNRQLLGSLTQN